MSAEQDNQMIENSLLREATEDGIREGIKQGQDEIILNMSQKGLTPSEISNFTNIDIDYINKCLKTKN